MKYLLAIVGVVMLVGLVLLHLATVPPASTALPYPLPEPDHSIISGPPVVPVEPEPVPVHKPVHKHYRKHVYYFHGHYFHGQRCATKWLVLPGSVTCESSGLQFLPNELSWSISAK